MASGRNKTQAKKRAYREHCRQMRLDGFVNDGMGAWTQNYKSLGISEATYQAGKLK